jgi:hypothetical protein
MKFWAWAGMRYVVLAVGVSAFQFSGVPAGVYSDDLAKCLVSHTTPKDQTEFLRWMFAAISYHPDVADLVSLTPEKRSEMTKNAGRWFERLLTESCAAQFRDASKYEGAQAVSAGFQMLGQVAMRGLMAHPDVQKGLAELNSVVSQEKLDAIRNSESP